MRLNESRFREYALRLTFKTQFAIQRAMARPKKGEELKATSYVGARIPDELRERLDAMAEKNGRSITDEVRAALEAHAKRGRK
jgi:hypothetical protein